MKRLVVFTGAGMSADSGLATFRDTDGLWADYRIEEVCTPEALARDRKKVIDQVAAGLILQSYLNTWKAEKKKET